MQSVAAGLRLERKRIGLVPTMGALHEGHRALIHRAREISDAVVVTIFVNPMQFGPSEDLERYPRPFDSDVAEAGSAGADYVFAPAVAEMYPAGYQTRIHIDKVTRLLEGVSRPDHFDGVATVVAKLFNIIMPDVAVFGQKDGQQLVVVKRLVADLNFPVEVVAVPTVRETDGLAMSSRNVYLSTELRKQAPVVSQSLEAARRLIQSGERNAATITGRMADLIHARSAGRIDYVSIADADTLEEQESLKEGSRVMVSLAVRFSSTRLIDNIVMDVRTLTPHRGA